MPDYFVDEFIEPDEGYMACGEEGIGRLPDIETISKYVIKKLSEISQVTQL